MKATIKITCDNAAFVENEGNELARILRGLASLIEGLNNEELTDVYNSTIPLRDINGNTVGTFKIA